MMLSPLKDLNATRSPISGLDLTEERWSVSLLNGKSIGHSAVVFEGKEPHRDETWAWGAHFGTTEESSLREIDLRLLKPKVMEWPKLGMCLDRVTGKNESGRNPHNYLYDVVKSWEIPFYVAQAAQEMVLRDMRESRIQHYTKIGDVVLIADSEDSFMHNCASYAARILRKCKIYGLNTGCFRFYKSPNNLAEVARDAEYKDDIDILLEKKIAERRGDLVEQLRLTRTYDYNNPGLLVDPAPVYFMESLARVKVHSDKAIEEGLMGVTSGVIGGIGATLKFFGVDVPTDFSTPSSVYQSLKSPPRRKWYLEP